MLVAVATLLVVVPAAVADDPPLPWVGGLAVETPLERYAGELSSAVAGRPVTVICNGATDWGELAAQQRFDPVTVWGFVVFNFDGVSQAYRPVDYMQLSEAACWYLDQYWRAPLSEKGKRCQVSTQITFKLKKTRVKEKRRVKARGVWTVRWVWVTKTSQVPVSVPHFGICPDYQNRVFALQSIAHESQHLAGIQDEATAECAGMQRLAWFAQRFGATPEQAREMAGDYFHNFYELKRPGTPYYQPSCPDPSVD